MKKLLTITLIFFACYSFGQKLISNPKVILDTTYAGKRFVFSWDGNMKLLPADSVLNMEVGSQTNYDYLSTRLSYAELIIKKQVIITVNSQQDTLVRYNKIQIPFYDILNPVNDLYNSKKLTKAVNKILNNEIKKKTSQQ